MIGIGFLLHVVFRSARDALLIMVNLPLALIGGVAGVFLSGGVLSVASLIGFITVFGIAARNGIMMVSHIRHLQRFEGVHDFREAVYRGAMERLAPILMTALAAGLGADPAGHRRRQAGQRNPDTDGDRHPVRTTEFNAAKHDRTACSLRAPRPARAAGKGPRRYANSEA